MLRVGPPLRQAVNDTRKPTGNIQCRCLSIQNRTIPPIPSPPRRGLPCPPEDLASFLYRIVMPSHPSATNARLAALRNGSRNADKIQAIPERNDDPDPKSDVSSAHPSRIPDESPEWFFAYPPSETATHRNSRAAPDDGTERLEPDCCRSQLRDSDSGCFMFPDIRYQNAASDSLRQHSGNERRPHDPERISADIGDRFPIPFPAPSLGMFSGADRLDFPEKILILHNYDFVSSCRFVCITK